MENQKSMQSCLKKVRTDDGSISFYHSRYEECLHSKSGAVEEAFKKFAEPCRIREIAEKKQIRILDICFGLGYNSCAAIDTVLGVFGSVEIVALEKDRTVLKKIHTLADNEVLFRNYDIIKEAAERLKYEDSRISIVILCGDARDEIKKIKGKFDAVFLDPFSPKKNPELWTEKFMHEIFLRMHKGAIMATYSCARIVRDNMRKAGFVVMDGPSVGRRAPGTLAMK